MKQEATSPEPVIAAGAVCWRVNKEGKLKVLLVYRAGHADVSLPKGKVDPGETLPETAVREVAEETGISVGLGVPLGVVEYQISGGRDKRVHYWAAEVGKQALVNAKFTPSAEISGLRWVVLAKARHLLSYSHDVDILDRFAELYTQEKARTFAIIALRHAKAIPAENWDGPDSTRPLLQRGIDQARGVAPGIAAFHPERLLSSPAERCLRTILPVVKLTGLAVREKSAISQDNYRTGGHAVYTLVDKQFSKKVTTVLCSHGPVLPQIIAAVVEASATPDLSDLRRASSLQVGEFAVLHIPYTNPETGIVAVEVHSTQR